MIGIDTCFDPETNIAGEPTVRTTTGDRGEPARFGAGDPRGVLAAWSVSRVYTS